MNERFAEPKYYPGFPDETDELYTVRKYCVLSFQKKKTAMKIYFFI